MKELVKKYIWHMSGHHWDKLMDKYYETAKTLGAAHQRFLNKRSRASGSRARKNSGNN